MPALYNEIDPFAAEWLENLANAKQIAPGLIIEGSIKDVTADDLEGVTQFHAFAGIGVWSYALRLAGWPDEVPIWTGSCPCQPFSGAGRRQGALDARHLWPDFFRLIRECRPVCVIGEQVASPDGRAWMSAVRVDLEELGYAVGAGDICSAGIGAPHIRQRLYWVALASGERREGIRVQLRSRQSRQASAQAARRGAPSSLADADNTRLQVGSRTEVGRRAVRNARFDATADVVPSGVGHADLDDPRQHARDDGAGITRGFWADAEWIYCRDGVYRPAKPGTPVLASRSPGDLGKLRAYGGSLTAQVAQTFIEAVMEVL